MAYQPGINQQPGAVPNAPGAQVYMPMPDPIPGVPAGLEYLSQIDQLVVKQSIELFEMFTDFETSNKYKVRNSMGQDVYNAVEESDFCSRQCCGPNRSFKIHIKDAAKRDVIIAERPFVCTVLPCFSSCRFEMTVKSPMNDEVLGYIRQNFYCCHPNFSVLDANMTEIFKVEGPCIQCGCSDKVFEIQDLNGTKCGAVTKKWSGILKEAYTDADNFNVSFPIDLDVKLKATLLSLVFMIDFMFYEQPANNN